MIKFGARNVSGLIASFAVLGFVSSFVMGSVARAETMECLISVYTAQDVIDEKADPLTSTQVVTMPLVNGEADLEVQIHGETVALSAWKFEHTDMYNFSVMLLTPKADLPSRGPSAVAVISDYLFNDGPTRDNGWDLNPGPNATRFSYLNRQNGSFGASTKLIAALKAAGKWGTYPFNATQMDVQNISPVEDFVKEQVAAKTMQPTDVIGISTVLSCTRR